MLVHVPSPRGWLKIHDLAYEVQQHGATPVAFNWLRDLLREEVPASCEHVVLAMTEFAPVVRQLGHRGRRKKKLIDPIDIYAEALAREVLGMGHNQTARELPKPVNSGEGIAPQWIEPSSLRQPPFLDEISQLP